jgi:5-methylcytosine-specific restriction endonuclease McrA
LCGLEKPLSEYYRQAGCSEGRRRDCKSCVNARNREYWRKHRDRLNAQAAERYAADPETHRARIKAWRLKNPDAVKAMVKTRRARKRGVEATLTQREWAVVLEQFENRCAYCGRDGKMTMDHVIPITQDGPHAMENVVPACGACNDRKGARTPEQAGMEIRT